MKLLEVDAAKIERAIADEEVFPPDFDMNQNENGASSLWSLVAETGHDLLPSKTDHLMIVPVDEHDMSGFVIGIPVAKDLCLTAGWREWAYFVPPRDEWPKYDVEQAAVYMVEAVLAEANRLIRQANELGLIE